MPGDIGKYSKYAIDKPYPELEVEEKNVYYADILLKDYAGIVSELTAINLYSFQHFNTEDQYNDYAELIGGIAVIEMKHLELLGETLLSCLE